MAKAFKDQEIELIFVKRKIAELETKFKRLTFKQRKKIPNPNKRFIDLSDILTANVPAPRLVKRARQMQVVEEESDEEDSWSTNDRSDLSEVEAPMHTRSRRSIRMPTRYMD